MRSILSIAAGVVVGILAVFFIERINLSLYPLPVDLNIESKEELTSYMRSLPHSAFVLVIIAHVVGGFLSSFIAGMVARSKRMRIGLIAGIFLLIFAIVNSLNVFHPTYILVIVIVLTAVGGLFGAKVGASRNVS